MFKKTLSTNFLVKTYHTKIKHVIFNPNLVKIILGTGSAWFFVSFKKITYSIETNVYYESTEVAKLWKKTIIKKYLNLENSTC